MIFRKCCIRRNIQVLKFKKRTRKKVSNLIERKIETKGVD